MLNRRRFHAVRNVGGSIQSLGIEECYALAYYMHGIFIEYPDNEIPGEYIDTFFKLVKRAGLSEEFSRILKAQVKKMTDDGLLEPIKAQRYDIDQAGGEVPIPTFRGTKIHYQFNEDSDIDDELPRDINSKKAPIIDIYRWLVITDGEGTFSKIVSKAFLGGKGLDDIAPKIRKVVDDISQVKFIADAVGLSDNEARVLLFLYRMNTISEMKDILNREIYDKIPETCEKILRIDAKEINTIFRSDQKLKAFGFIEDDGEITVETLDCIKTGSMDAFFAEILKEEDTRKAFKIDSYAISDESVRISKKLLMNNQSVNILLYGAPGSGKTEFAKTLARECGLKAFVFKNDTELNKRTNILCRLNCLLSINKAGSLIIIDEADTLLETQMSFITFLMGDGSSTKKGTVNKIFENSNNKVVWIVNHTRQIEQSTKRRFTYSVRFNEMPEKTLCSIADTQLKKVSREKKISRKTHSKIIEICRQYHVTGSSVENIEKMLVSENLELDSEEDVLKDIRSVLDENSSLLFGKPKMRMKVASTYDESVLNTNFPADKIVKMIENAKKFSEKNRTSENGIRFLFYGLSGTGKTEFARHISQKIGKQILLKRVSDISDMYVGETEKHIRAAFEEAEASDKILLFDEADSFFADRAGAARSWERTQVNEFLTQMEEFSGILICTTNLKEIMDPAMNRRFHLCVQFSPLKSEGIRTLLERFFGSFKFSKEEINRIAMRPSVTPGDFGTLSSRIRFMDEDDLSPSFIIDELCNIQDEKNGGKAIGFGK